MKSARFARHIATAFPFAIALAACGEARAAANRPTLELFPMPVLENLRQTARSAQSLERNLEGDLRDLELQFEIYEASRCTGSIDDVACQEIERQIRQTYSRVLDGLLKELPAIEELVKSTERNLASTLRTQVGNRLSPRDLQRHLNNRPGSESAIRQNSGPRVGRMSQNFQRYYEMVSRARGAESSATMAADIYLDSREALQWIALAQQDMAAARTELEISLTWEGMNPQVMQTVSQVKALIFGTPSTLPDAPAARSQVTDANVRALELY